MLQLWRTRVQSKNSPDANMVFLCKRRCLQKEEDYAMYDLQKGAAKSESAHDLMQQQRMADFLLLSEVVIVECGSIWYRCHMDERYG